MLKLNNLSSGGKDRKRVGRGGSRGGTSGKGHKGQKARSGGAVGPVKEGGQMPLVRRIPKRGFNNARFRTSFSIVNIDRLEELFNEGDVVTREVLIQMGEMHRDDMLKILGNGELTKKLTVHADAFSESAQEAIKSKGGQVHLTQEL